MKLHVVQIPAAVHVLAGLYYLPDKSPRKTGLVFAHGFTSGKHSMDLLASYLAGRGYPGLSFDFVGHKLGATGGEMRSIRQAIDNVGSAVSYLRRQAGIERVVLVGHSMGAAASLLYVSQGDMGVSAVISLCMGTEPARGFTDTIGRAMVTQRGDYVAGAPATDLLLEMDGLVAGIHKIDTIPVLCLAANQDVLIPPARVEEFANRIGETATFRILEATHLDAPDRARGTVAEWLSQNSL